MYSETVDKAVLGPGPGVGTVVRLGLSHQHSVSRHQEHEGGRQHARTQSRTEGPSLPRPSARLCQRIAWSATQQWSADGKPSQWSGQPGFAKHVALHLESHLKVSSSLGILQWLLTVLIGHQSVQLS